MALDDLNAKLHSRNFHADRTRPPVLFDPEATRKEPATEALGKTEAWQKPVDTPMPEPQKKAVRLTTLGVGIILLFVVILGVAYKLNDARYSEEKVSVNLVGENNAESAKRVTYTFEYENDNWADLENVSLIFEYPESFSPDETPGLLANKSRAEKKLEMIPSEGKGTVVLSGTFYGLRGDMALISGTLRFTPSSTSGTFEKRAIKEVRVASSPFSLEILAPTELASDQEVSYEIRYANNSAAAVSNLKVKLEYPDGFVYTSAEPSPSSGDALFALDTLGPQSTGKIIVRGRLRGERDEQKTVYGAIGIFQGDGTFAKYSDHEKRTRVVASPFDVVIRTVTEGKERSALDAGDDIEFVVEYKNASNVGIRDAILTVTVDTPYLNTKSLSFSRGANGAYVQSTKSIVWKASDMRELSRVEPGQKGTVSFSMNTFADLRERFPGVRNPTFSVVAKIDSPDIPALIGQTRVVASSVLPLRLNSEVTATLTGSYEDALFPNSGPVPPVPGQETTYTLRYKLSNTTNDVESGRVTVLFPSGIRFTGKKSPDNEKMIFNERANELTWDVGLLKATESRELIFQIGVTPDPNAGADTLLVNRSNFSGKDLFTGKEFKIDGPKLSTAL